MFNCFRPTFPVIETSTGEVVQNAKYYIPLVLRISGADEDSGGEGTKDIGDLGIKMVDLAFRRRTQVRLVVSLSKGCVLGLITQV